MMHFNEKSFWRRSAAFLTALALVTALTGCNQNGNSPTDQNGNSTNQNNSGNQDGNADSLGISLDYSYSSEPISIDDLSVVNTVAEFQDKLIITGYNYSSMTSDGSSSTVSDVSQKVYLYQPDTQETSAIELNYPSTLEKNVDYYISASYVNSQQQLAFLYHASTYDEENTENPYQDLGYTLETYDKDLNLVETKAIDAFTEDDYISQIVSDMNGTLYISMSDPETGEINVHTFDEEFKETGKFDPSFQYIMQMQMTDDGKLVIAYQSDSGNKFGELDPQTKTLEEVQIENLPAWYNYVIPAKKDYDFFVYDSTNVYGINLSEKSCEVVLNWINSDFSGDTVNNLVQLNDGRFIAVESQYRPNVDPKSALWVLTKRDPKEFENVQLITLSTLYMPSNLNVAVNQFNRSHSDYRIGVKDYSEYDSENDYEAGMKKFESDMTSGIMADIICLSGLPYESYVNKGLLLDLTDYVNTLSPDEYFTNFFDSMKYNDKLYQIGFSFCVQTLGAKTKHVDGKSGLSSKEFIDLINNLPEGMESRPDMTKDSALGLFICVLNQFIDTQNATCSFNSPEFTEILEFCNTFPDEITEDQSDWSQEEWETFWNEQDFAIINDKQLLYDAYISDLYSAFNEQKRYFGDEEMTFVGYPTAKEGSNGGRFAPDYTVAVAANTTKFDQIQELFNEILSEEFQENLDWAIPVQKKAFDKFAATAIKPIMGEDDNGNVVELPYTVWRGQDEVEVTPPNQKDVDNLKTYIENMTELNYYNEEIWNIVTEEVAAYFSGDKTAQAVAEQIQSRASLYLAEQS